MGLPMMLQLVELARAAQAWLLLARATPAPAIPATVVVLERMDQRRARPVMLASTPPLLVRVVVPHVPLDVTVRAAAVPTSAQVRAVPVSYTHLTLPTKRIV